ncbi:MAG: penicillin-binding transpeptidase domain-containing protein [Chthoniobacterales bacterium]|nr:penicillin-binding transpeptidase domain-containing protein [Chthoniobacterales bacterium]
MQRLDNTVTAAYPGGVRAVLPIRPEVLEALTKAFVAVTESGTWVRARVKGMNVVGKTGTAQWGPKQR